jgi:FHA domain
VKLLPSRLVKRIVKLPDTSLPFMGKLPILLVLLRDTAGQLAYWLDETTKNDRLSSKETTGTITKVTKITDFGAPRPPPRKVSTMKPAELRRQLEEAPYFASLLRKRNFSSADERISVGRSRQRDVVLCDPSVSNLHAWINCDDDGVHYIMDNESTNGTRLNGRRLSKRMPTDVSAGDHIEFGDLQAVWCDLSTLRSALLLAAKPHR